jgi:hypothetical protein
MHLRAFLMSDIRLRKIESGNPASMPGNDPDVPVIYTPKFNEFGVRVLDFCPWCGQKSRRVCEVPVQ